MVSRQEFWWSISQLQQENIYAKDDIVIGVQCNPQSRTRKAVPKTVRLIEFREMCIEYVQTVGE